MKDTYETVQLTIKVLIITIITVTSIILIVGS